MTYRNPFPLPDHLPPALQPVLSYWQELKRAESAMPFADDIDLSILSNLTAKALILRVFALPERFRFEFLGNDLRGSSEARTGGFLDEISLGGDFSYLRAQSSTTVEAAMPTFCQFTGDPERSFSRLLLPVWGNGEISMLVGAVS